MDAKDQKIAELKQIIATAEESLEVAKKALAEITGEDYKKTAGNINPSMLSSLKVSDGGQVIEGIFNGENMVGPEGKVFPVPANYASKSKLVEGDRLKLTIADDGSFIFKQIGPVERKNIVGTLEFENNAYHVSAEGKIYNVLYASVSYFKAKPGDRVTIVAPMSAEANWAALENIIHEVPAPTDNVVPVTGPEPVADPTPIDAQPTEEGVATVQEDLAELAASRHEKVIPVPEEDLGEMNKSLSDLPDFPDLDSLTAPETTQEAPAPEAQTNPTPTDNFFDSLEASQTPAQPQPVAAGNISEPTAEASAGPVIDEPAAEAKELDI